MLVASMVGNQKKEISNLAVLKSPSRYLAESNRPSRFCRPVTKPLIQGTSQNCDAKVILYFVISNFFCTFFIKKFPRAEFATLKST